MSWLSSLLRQAGAGLRVLLALTVLTGVVYPLGVWAVAHIPGLAYHAEGSQLPADGQPVGSSLIGVDLVAADPNTDRWFHTRPSATASDVLRPGDPSTSGGSSKAADNPELIKFIEKRRTLIATRESVPPNAVPPDALTASGSGVDPHISPAYATLQVPRVAWVSGLSEQRVRELVDAHTDRPFLGFLGEAGGERAGAQRCRVSGTTRDQRADVAGQRRGDAEASAAPSRIAVACRARRRVSRPLPWKQSSGHQDGR